MLDTQSSVLKFVKDWWGDRAAKGNKPKMQIKPSGEGLEKLNSEAITTRQIKHLMDLVDYNHSKMSKLRVSAKAMRQQYYSHMMYEDAANAEQAVIINKLQAAVRIYLQNMATGVPQLFMDTNHPQLRPWAWSFEHSVNKHLEEIGIGEVFSIGTFDALFSAGCFKTGLGAGAVGVYDEHGELIDPGRAFTDAVQIDDFLIDMSAKDPTRIDLIGDKFLRPRGWVKDMMKRSKRGEPYVGVDTPSDSSTRPQALITGHDEHEEHRLYDEVYVWDLYLPKENLIVQIADGAEEPIAVFEWEGPEGGPYDILSFLPASGAPLGPAIGMSLYELHMYINEVMRKVGRQTNRQKSVTVYEKGAEEAAETLRSSNDGEVLGVAPGMLDRIREMSMGGADPMNGQMLALAMNQFDQEGGNLQSLGGLGPSAETFRGDKMINESASSLINYMQVGLMKTAKSVLRKHAWWVWTEDIREYNGFETVPGTEISVPWSFTPEEREGDFLDYNFNIQPFSMVEVTPQQKAMKVLEMYNNLAMPSAEIMMQQGYMPNTVETAKYVCRLMGVPFDILFAAMDPEQQMQLQQQLSQGMVQAPPRMKESHTVNERVSRPGTTPNGQMNEFSRSMSALGGQQAQAS